MTRNELLRMIESLKKSKPARIHELLNMECLLRVLENLPDRKEHIMNKAHKLVVDLGKELYNA